ncbi:hypothetical protein J5N97_027815 [Dioscorea zingiberensis]|uniref:Neprosin PEP catalytic domain-containing protein n=1 Tax=Dioscorea zingiberensis TaxID=325984 RepID=A0A9D5BXT6_9LILI|nr:hypothetical protein J5N97_027815 [Dioscorea zingiberensis]
MELAMLLILLLLLLLQLQAPSMAAQNDSFYYDRCAPFKCGNITVSFPFSTSETFCSPPGYEVSCYRSTSIPILSLSSISFTVKDINLAAGVITLSDTVLVQTLQSNRCDDLQSHFLTAANFTPFQLPYWTKTLNLALCRTATTGTNISTATLRYDGCGGNQSIYILRSDALSDDPLPAACSFASLPAQSTNLLQVNLSKLEDVLLVLNGGFPLQWQNFTDCWDCQAAGGRCGFNRSTQEVLCFCGDGCVVGRQLNRPSDSWKIIIGTVIPTVVILLVGVIVFVKFRAKALSIFGSFSAARSLSRTDSVDVKEFIKTYRSTWTIEFSYKELKKNTDGFKHKLGSGGFEEEAYFPDWIYDQMNKWADMELDDSVVDFDISVSRKMVMVGLWCIQVNPVDRPSISTAIGMLTGRLESIAMPPKPLLIFPPKKEMSQSVEACVSGADLSLMTRGLFSLVLKAGLYLDQMILMILMEVGFFKVQLSSSTFGIGLSDGNSLTINEEMEIEKQLKLLNKPAIKTIVDDGDIYDCVDINKQPAFDHPSLKNHKIQLSPSSYPDGLFDNDISSSTNATSIEIGLKNGNACPSGTVPIRRVSKDDLIRMRSSLNHKKMMHYSPSNYLNGDNDIYQTVAAYHTYKKGDEYFGASASINVFGLPQLTRTQFSSSLIWIVNNANPLEHNLIRVGWTVDPNTYGDTKTRLTTAWTRDDFQHTGCIDIKCLGFVQVSKQIPLGSRMSPLSTYNGQQYTMQFTVFRDPVTYNWWFTLGKEKTTIGYWPNKLFTTLRDHASWLNFGGVAGSLGRKEMPPMGSGHLSCEGLLILLRFEGRSLYGSSDPDDLDGGGVLQGPIVFFKIWVNFIHKLVLDYFLVGLIGREDARLHD